MKIRKSIGDRIFDIFNVFLMLLIVFVTLYPLWYVLVASLSNGQSVTNGEVIFWIKNFELRAYTQILSNNQVWISYINTIFYAVVGTFISMVITTLGAYALSKKRLRGRGIIMLAILLSMWFSPGIMPQYVTYRNFNLLDTRLCILMIGAVGTFNVILMRTYFESIPESIEEAAKIDGASDFQIFSKIVLPLSTAAMVTITLYYFVGRWNAYFWSMIVLKDPNKMPLQVLLKKYVVEMTQNNSDLGTVDYSVTSRETTIYATIVISTLPMIIIYPFIQKYFVKGVMIGAVKG